MIPISTKPGYVELKQSQITWMLIFICMFCGHTPRNQFFFPNWCFFAAVWSRWLGYTNMCIIQTHKCLAHVFIVVPSAISWNNQCEFRYSVRSFGATWQHVSVSRSAEHAASLEVYIFMKYKTNKISALPYMIKQFLGAGTQADCRLCWLKNTGGAMLKRKCLCERERSRGVDKREL